MTTPTPQPLPAVYLLPAPALAALAHRLGTGEAGPYAPALAALLAEADEAVMSGPWSVMDKAITPPSGDKHDYMSLSTYVWPDPSKPDGLPYLMRDGQRNPETVRYDELPLKNMAAAVQTLALAAYLPGPGAEARRTAYARRAALLARTWFVDPATRMNPNLNFGQCVPGLCTGHRRGIIDTASTFPHLLDALGLLAAAFPELWPPADRAALAAWMAKYLDWLLTSEFGQVESQINNNHAVACDGLVASLALHTGRRDLARQRLADARTRRIAVQIWPDGSMPREVERTMGLHYVVWNLRCFMHLARLGEHVDVDLWNYRSSEGRCLRKAAEWALPYLDLSTPWPYQQINPMDPQNIIAVCRLASLGWGDARFERIIARLPHPAASRTQLLYPVL